MIHVAVPTGYKIVVSRVSSRIFVKGGANAVIAGLRGDNNYSSVFRVVCQRGKIIAHS